MATVASLTETGGALLLGAGLLTELGVAMVAAC